MSTTSACGVTQVTPEQVLWARWSSVGERILFRVAGNSAYWAYRLDTRAVEPATTELIRDAAPDIAVPLPAGLPAGLRPNGWKISPSGRKTVFIGAEEVPSAPADWEGEWWPDPDKTWFTVCVLDETTAVRTCMAAENGLVDTFVWLPDEQSFLVVTTPRLPGTAYLWMGVLGRQKLEPLLLQEPDKPQAVFEGVSPTGDAILYHNGTELVLLDLASRVERAVALLPNPGRWYSWFLSDTSLLWIDDFDTPLDFYIHTVDLETGQQCRLFEKPMRVDRIALSPDGKHLLIIWEDTRELYVYRLCAPCS